MNNILEIKKENIIDAYKSAKSAGNTYVIDCLEALFGKCTFAHLDVTERIKTFEDACNELTYDHPYVKEYQEAENNNIFGEEIKAFLKLRIIVTALNEGWDLVFGSESDRYYPLYNVFPKQEINKFPKEDRNSIFSRPHRYLNAFGGIVIVYWGYECAGTYVNQSSQFSFKNRELAEYCGKQFIEIVTDFLFA